MPWPPTIPPATRSDSTAQATVHAQDHNQASQALTDIVTKINSLPTGGGGTGYLHDQSTPAAVWNVAHNLGYKPGGIWVEDSAGTDLEAQVAQVDNNNLTITFPGATSGKAYIS